MSTRRTYQKWLVRVLAVAAVIAVGLIARRLTQAHAEGTQAAAAAKKYTRNVAIVLYEGVEILDFAGPAEVFAAAAGPGNHQGQPAFKVYTVAVSREPIKSQGFITVTPEYSVDDAPAPDIVVIPGGSSQALLNSEKFMAWAKNMSKDAEITLTVCTGAFIPAKMGLLDGLTVTTWYGAVERLKKAAPKANVQDGRRFVDNGSIITTAGVSAGIDGALHTVARLLGRHVADETARYMEYHWTPEPYLAKSYSHMNPSLDDHGREAQAASLYEDKEDYAGAEKAYRALLERDPKNGYAWYRLGFALHSMGQLDQAIEAHKKASTFADIRPKALFNLACAYARKGQTDDAIASLMLATEAGFKDKGAIQGDPDLESVRSDGRYRELLKTL